METPKSWLHRRAIHYVEVAKRLDLDPTVTDALLDYVLGVDDLLDRNDAGQYSLSDFGDQVMARYSDSDSDKESRSINMFDVRVGATCYLKYRSIGNDKYRCVCLNI